MKKCIGLSLFAPVFWLNDEKSARKQSLKVVPIVNELEDGFHDVWIAYRGGLYQIGHVNVGIIFLFIRNTPWYF